jgi:hypothetical protein
MHSASAQDGCSTSPAHASHIVKPQRRHRAKLASSNNGPKVVSKLATN